MSPRPIAPARWLLPPPGGPNTSKLSLFSSQLSPATKAMTWALESEEGQETVRGTVSPTNGDGVEVEAVEGLAGRQARLREVTLDPASLALGELVLGDGHEEPGGGPALLVGALGEAGPDVLDARQAQLAEQKAEAGFVDGICRGHAGAPSARVVSTS